MALELLGYLLIALLGIGLSALFSGMETGLYTINRVRLTVRASRGDQRAMRLRSLINRPTRMLSTLLIGNNIANYAGSFGIAAILDFYGVAPVSAIVINVLILVSLLFVFGETLPKDLFRTHTDHWSYALSSFVTWCSRVLTWTGLGPIVERFGAVSARILGASEDPTLAGAGIAASRKRISQLIKEGVTVGVLSEAQTTLADRALAMREIRVTDEMVPWRGVVTFDMNDSPQVRRRLVERHHFSRFPVIDRTRGGEVSVVGTVSMLDVLLEPERPTQDMLEPIVELPAKLPLREAIARLRESGSAMGIITAKRSGRPIGLVTFKDLVEPLTGELAW